MENSKPILCLDFDGVIHSYTSGWKGARVIPDPPVPGALDFILRASSYFEIHIFSSRSNQFGGRAAMKRWLFQAFAPLLTPKRLRLIMNAIQFPSQKPAAMVSLDDRAITFTGMWPPIEALLAFRPWNKKRV